MTQDLIVEEVRAARDKIAEEHGHDLARIFAALRAMSADSDVERVTLPRRLPQRAPVDTAGQQAVAADGASRRS